jgi:hypothetical protein
MQAHRRTQACSVQRTSRYQEAQTKEHKQAGPQYELIRTVSAVLDTTSSNISESASTPPAAAARVNVDAGVVSLFCIKRTDPYAHLSTPSYQHISKYTFKAKRQTNTNTKTNAQLRNITNAYTSTNALAVQPGANASDPQGLS